MSTMKISTDEDFNEMYAFFQLITLCPHPHFTRHVCKKSAFYMFENFQVRRSTYYRRPFL